jgi:hypothetical protein
MTARQDHNIESNVEVSGEQLEGFIGEDEDLEELEVLGFATMSTIGQVTVDRDWLIPRMEELGIPEFMQPNQPRVSSAYKRALKEHRLFDTGERIVNGHRVQHEVNSGEGNTYHLLSNVYIPASQIAEERDVQVEETEEGALVGPDGEEVDGEWRQVQLGMTKYDEGNMVVIDSIENEHALYEEWSRLKSKLTELFEDLQTSHVGYDFQVLTYHLRKHWTNSVPLRDGGAVAFIPATEQTTEVLESLHVLLSEVNQEWKDSGRDIELNTIPVLNTDSQRQMVEQRAQDQVQEIASDLVSEAEEQIRDDMPVQEIAQEIQSELSEAEDFASQYNNLLDAELSARELIEEWFEDFDDDLRQVLAEAGFNPDDDDSEEPEIVEKGGGYFGIEVEGEEVESIQGRDAAESYVEDNF